MFQHILVYGGTFDPVHNAHIALLNALLAHPLSAELGIDHVLVIPCRQHRLKPDTYRERATPEQRLAMLKLAFQDNPRVVIDEREIRTKNTITSTAATLKSLRQEHPDTALTFLMGYDSFLTLEQWTDWTCLLTLANLLIMRRGQETARPSGVLRQWEKDCMPESPGNLLQDRHGYILHCDVGCYALSSTFLRRKLKEHADVSKYLPPRVEAYIRAHRLYGVSSEPLP